ncbi:alpha-L-fucosidase [Paucibacter oligotrophus]|uniref:alpha-L-fucosidase n=1 Tax=Roseateles oligotrophus TaxID=1769250 RepID=A0A840L523_9BURK|nr:alpha-L-fucosidase [Roseateles oligotrophus]MBB4843654.1 alpha-L-fucosidase [Roseateles oligotrophus]
MNNNSELRRHLALACLALALGGAAPGLAAQAAPAAPQLADPLNRKADYGWFVNERFGMFIHFGLYANAARHEWIMNKEKLSVEAYRKYFDSFNPDLFDARAWARSAKAAGMKYMVLTAKHHEGFALWDTQLSDYKISNTAFKRDLVREFVDAARAEGLKVGFYYSLIDWHHPEFPIDGYHPLREDETAKKVPRDMAKYRSFMHGQVRELLSNYGKIDYLWFDFSYPNRPKDWSWGQGKGREDWHSEELVKLVHQLQPRILLNNRLDLPGGVQTPEDHQPRFDGLASEFKLTEECHTLYDSWGYRRDTVAWKSSEAAVRLLVDAVSKGNNLLLNVGPNGRGEFEPGVQSRLAALGEWTRLHGRAIQGAGASAFTAPDGTRYTQRGKRLYLHLQNYPMGGVELPGLAGKVSYAQFLHDGSEIQFKEPQPRNLQNNAHVSVSENAIRLSLPMNRPELLLPVVELFLK